MNKTKLVIIDLDDTIYSEYDYVQSGFRHVAEQISSLLNYSVPFLMEKMNGFFINDKKTVFNQLINLINVNNVMNLEKLIHLYKFHIPQIKPYDDFYDFCKNLEMKNISLVLLTDGDTVQQKNKVTGLKIEKYFRRIYYSDSYGIEFRKPNSKIYLEIINDLKIDNNEIIVVGDNPNKDFYCKESLGISSIQIIRPNAIYAFTNKYYGDVKPDLIVESLNQIIFV